ncbi:hypothetical protein MFRU_021g00880 [Monilinia fructicola]|uniref:Chromo domain-containing protein n=1 Tax=Monilinia fructicola TaxID=38448 RepID=A0A5M9K6D8_MONFR|nr:hypothetical protein EYC84_007194 [Monilinia fructicola]KAG4028499.1 hypothetical protein MFRU_021g00880 [Monilinia fructicola]
MSSEYNSDFAGDDTNLSKKSILAFDFKVVERPIYIPNSGPPLQPISLIPPHTLKGIILDCFPYPKSKDPSHFLVGYEKEPHNRLIVHPDNIRNYVSEYTLENWEHERSTAEENRAIKELQPRLLAAERARVLRELKKAGLSRDVLKGEDAELYQTLGMPKKRGRPPKSMASVFKPAPKPLPISAGGKRGPGRPRKVVEVHVTSPTLSHHHQPSLSQPSLSQPSLSQAFSTASRAMAEHAIASSGSEGEDDDTDLALHLQINNEGNPGSSSTLNSSTALKASNPSGRIRVSEPIHKTHMQSPQKSKPFKKSPHNRPRRAPILPGMSVDEYQYDRLNIDAYNKNKSMRNEKNSTIQQQQHPASTQQLPAPSMGNVEKSTDHIFHGTNLRQQGKIFDYFNKSDSKSPAPKTVEANRHVPPVSNLKRKSFPSSGREGKSNGKSRSKNRRFKNSDDYLDADYKEPSKKAFESAINDRSSRFDVTSSVRLGSDAFNLRNSRSRSRRLGSPEDEVEDEDEGIEEGKRERDLEEDFVNEPPVWAVKGILDHKYQWNQNHDKQELWYFVDWEGDWDPSWEPATLVSKTAIDGYVASRQARGLGNLYLSVNAMDIGGNGNELSRGNDLERSVEYD